LHLQNAYKDLEYKQGDFPASESVAAEIVSLPMFPTLRPDQQERVVREVMNFLSGREMLQNAGEPQFAAAQ
jgi:UDP-2-acetamido-2-deoxy-ribo-hexuluronate aminotransferase